MTVIVAEITYGKMERLIVQEIISTSLMSRFS